MAEIAEQAAKPKTPVRTERGRFNEATHGLRGLASLAVFWAHLLGGTAEHIYDDNDFYVSLIFAPWSIGVWGVELFFAISGFVILPSVARYSLGQFALRRFLRIYPLFFVFSVIFIILNAITNEYPHTNNLEAIAAGLLFLDLFTGTEQLTPNAWSLTFEVIFYTLAAVGFAVIIRKPNKLAAIGFILVSCLFLYHYPIAVFFLGGAVVRLLYDRDIRPNDDVGRVAEVAFALACILLAGSFHFGFSQEDMASPYAWALAISTIGYFYFAVQPGSLTTMATRHAWIVYLGTVSYSLYLVHPYTYYAVRGVFERYDLFTDNWLASMILFFLVTTPLTLAVTHIAHRLLEVRVYQWFFEQRIYRGANK